MKRKRHMETFVVPPLNRVIRYKVDMVGNDITATLRWCSTHQEPVWVFGDGSYTCPQTRIIQYDDGTHVLVDGPWEIDILS